MDFAKSSIDTGMAFDSSMSQVAATMGTTVDQIGELRDFAQDMGAKTAFSATQAADALNYMALAGYDAEKSMKAMPNVLNLAAAGGMDLARASDMVTDAQSALGLSMEESTDLIDKMAMTASKSNTSVEQLGDAILTVGGTAKDLAGGTTELSTALGILADNGIKGAEGGTALRNIILSLGAPTDKAANKLKKMGVQVYDNTGKMRPLNETFKDLNNALATMTQGERTEVLNELFNKVDLKSANALLANSGDRFDELSRSIDNAAGAAERMAETQLDNLAGDITLMKSAVEGVQIALSDKLSPALRDATQFATDMIGEFQRFITDGGLDSLIDGFLTLAPAIAGATTAFLVYKGAAAISGVVDALTTSVTALNAALSANPLLTVATVAAGLAATLGALVFSTVDAREETENFYQSLRDAKDAYDGLMSSMAEEHKAVSTLAGRLKALTAEEDKSATTKDRIRATIEELNDAVPGLALAYDDASDSIINLDDGVKMTTEDIDAMLDRAENQEIYNAQVAELNRLQDDQVEISTRLAAAKEQLAGVEAGDAEMMERISAAYEAAGIQMQSQEDLAAALRGTVANLTTAESECAAQIVELDAATSAFAEGQGAAEQKVASMTTTVEGLVGRMDSLVAEYEESYNAAYSSISEQLGLFNELDGSAKTSIGSLIDTLKGQVDYMDTYAANIQKAMEMGVDEGLVQKLSDGSEESAQILDAIVKGGEEDIKALNDEFKKVEEGKQKFSDTVANMETDFNKKMGLIVEDTKKAAEKMDIHDETIKAGMNNIQGLIDGSSDPVLKQRLVDQYRELGMAALAAYKKEVGQASPSKKFAQAGGYDIIGIIEGAKGQFGNLADTYTAAGELALSSYNFPGDSFKTASVSFRDSAIGMTNAATINAMGGGNGNAPTVQLTAQLVTPDGKVMAEWIADPLANYMNANGTPILNPV